MAVTVPRGMLVEYVGVKPGGAAYRILRQNVELALTNYAALKSICDDAAVVAHRALERLRKALERLVATEAALPQAARDSLEGFTQDEGGRLVPDYPLNTITDFAARLRSRLDEALTEFELIRHYTPDQTRRRPEGARDYTVKALAEIFQTHYALDNADYKANLLDFLRGLMKANGLACPHHAALWKLVPKDCHAPRPSGNPPTTPR